MNANILSKYAQTENNKFLLLIVTVRLFHLAYNCVHSAAVAAQAARLL